MRHSAVFLSIVPIRNPQDKEDTQHTDTPTEGNYGEYYVLERPYRRPDGSLVRRLACKPLLEVSGCGPFENITPAFERDGVGFVVSAAKMRYKGGAAGCSLEVTYVPLESVVTLPGYYQADVGDERRYPLVALQVHVHRTDCFFEADYKTRHQGSLFHFLPITFPILTNLTGEVSKSDLAASFISSVFKTPTHTAANGRSVWGKTAWLSLFNNSDYGFRQNGFDITRANIIAGVTQVACEAVQGAPNPPPRWARLHLAILHSLSTDAQYRCERSFLEALLADDDATLSWESDTDIPWETVCKRTDAAGLLVPRAALATLCKQLAASGHDTVALAEVWKLIEDFSSDGVARTRPAEAGVDVCFVWKNASIPVVGHDEDGVAIGAPQEDEPLFTPVDEAKKVAFVYLGHSGYISLVASQKLRGAWAAAQDTPACDAFCEWDVPTRTYAYDSGATTVVADDTEATFLRSPSEGSCGEEVPYEAVVAEGCTAPLYILTAGGRLLRRLSVPPSPANTIYRTFRLRDLHLPPWGETLETNVSSLRRAEQACRP
eukprot:Rhum_TRINITY_DN11183_c0_g2::Rhum_TRINITY_DN11183_c0_g2_i1::g.42994::m.42994